MDDRALGVAATSSLAWVVGFTLAPFPVTPGYSPPFGGSRDAFATALTPFGAILRSRYLGGVNGDVASEVAVDAAGNAYVVGETESPDFPTTAGVLQPALAGPSDAFVTKISPTSTSSAPTWSTFLGGSGDEWGMGIAVDAARQPYLTGGTTSTDFPLLLPTQAAHAGGGWDGFVTRLNVVASAPLVSTYLGGSQVDFPRDLALDASGETHVVGGTSSSDFPTLLAVQPAFAGGGADGFLAVYRTSGLGFVHSTYFGGPRADLVLGVSADSARTSHIGGGTDSVPFPAGAATTWPTYGGAGDGFVARVAPGNTCLPVVGC